MNAWVRNNVSICRADVWEKRKKIVHVVWKGVPGSGLCAN